MKGMASHARHEDHEPVSDTPELVRPASDTPELVLTGSMRERAALLRTRGLRVTASRLAVLDLVEASTEPLAHHDLCQKLHDSPWNRSTLYRNLIDLTEVGVLVKTEIGGVMRFQRAGRHNACAEHAHFVCIDCGTVTHLEGVVVRVDGLEGADAAPKSISSGHIEVQLRGLCDSCTV